MEKKIFLSLMLLVIVGYAAWYVFVDMRQQDELNKTELKLKAISTKLNKARSAQLNLTSIEKRFEEEQKRLIQERTRFLNKNELSVVTETLKKMASRYKLKLLDFSPGLDSYFGTNPDDKIVALPIDIVVEGYYLDVGKFLEHWQDLPFYMLPNGLELKRANKNENVLHATINGALYTWNE